MMITAEILQYAIEYASRCHRNQRRKSGNRPYILHPFSVMSRVQSVKRDSQNVFLLMVVALLHDVVEDCDVALEEIAERFGHHVAALVGELTLDKDECERVGKYIYISGKMVQMSSYALTLKLCDIWDNADDMKEMSSEFQKEKFRGITFMMTELVSSGRKLTPTQNLIISNIHEVLLPYRKMAA